MELLVSYLSLVGQVAIQLALQLNDLVRCDQD